MKRVLLGMFLALSLCNFVACATSEDEEESLREKCYADPHLPECQELPEEEPGEGSEDAGL